MYSLWAGCGGACSLAAGNVTWLQNWQGLIIFGIAFEPFSYQIVKILSGFHIAICGLSLVNKALVSDSQKSILSFNLLGE